MVWFADIDQAKPTQELDDVGSVIGSNKMSFETLCSPIAQGLMKTMYPESTSKVRVAEEMQENISRC